MEYKFKFLDKRKISEVGLTVISFVSLFLGLLIISISMWLYFSPVDRYEEDLIQSGAFERCTNIFESNGYVVDQTPTHLNIEKVIYFKFKEELYTFDAIVARCKNFELLSMCMSPFGECNKEGLSATLRYKKPFSYQNSAE